MKSVYILNGTIGRNDGIIPVSYYYLREYHDDNGSSSGKWNWHLLSNTNAQDCLLQFQKAPPDVLGLSVYVWNYKNLYHIAKQVKSEYPDTIIVAGGPQVEYLFNENFWTEHDYIDIVIPDQGEAIFSDLLDHVYDGTTYNCPGIVYYHKTMIENDKIHSGQEKVWQSQWVIKYKDDLAKQVKQRKQNNYKINMVYETTRGCPYRCTYCDWGGGTYKKTKQKSLEVVKQEIQILAELEIDTLHIGDANFGIFKNDHLIAEHFVKTKQRTGYPQKIHYDSTKNNIQRNMQITEIFSKGDLLFHGQLALQDVDDDVMKITDRLNPDYKQVFEQARKLHLKTGIQFSIHLLFGLPGQTVSSIANSISKILSFDDSYFFARWSHLQVLPNTPLARSPIKEQVALQHRKLKTLYKSNPMCAKSDQDWTTMRGYGFQNVCKPAQYDTSSLITGCMSFNEMDLAKIYVLTAISSTLKQTGILDQVFVFLTHDQKQQVIYKVLEKIVDESSKVYTVIETILNNRYQWLIGNNDLPDIDINVNWPFTVDFGSALDYAVYTNNKIFIDCVVDAAEQASNQNLDCVRHWLHNIFIDHKYVPGKCFHATHPVTGETANWICKDTQTINGTSLIDISWHTEPETSRMQTYFFQTCLSKHGARIVQHIEKNY